MKPKLEKLVENPDFGKGALDMQTGIMVYANVPFTFLVLIYPNSYKLYLSIFDDKAPNDQLIITEAITLHDAQKQAEVELKRILNSNIH